MREMAKAVAVECRHAVMAIGRNWWEHSHSRSAAALAFYSLFSLAPILLITTRVAGWLIGRRQAEEGVEQATGRMFDERSGSFLREVSNQQADLTFTGISSVLGILVLLFAASRVLAELRIVLGHIFGKGKPEGRKQKVIGALLNRAIPFIVVLALGVGLAFAVVASTALGAMANAFEDWLPEWARGYGWVETLISFALLTTAFACTYRWLPQKPPSFTHAWLGALVSSVLMMALKGLISLYFSMSSVATAYGAAVTLAVVLLWIYFTVQILFIGAEVAAYLRERRAQTEAGLAD